MGKSKTIETGVASKKISTQFRNKSNSLVQKLLNKCASTDIDPKKELEHYTEIFHILQEIREMEKDYVVPFPNRGNNWKDFFSWCSKNDAKFDSVSVREIDSGNFGVFAEDDLKENDPFLSVPRKLMVTVEKAKESELGPLIEKDPMLKVMPNVVLSLYLIVEYLKNDSFWKPYFFILPSNYNTVLYYSLEELNLLKRSPVQSHVINICRSVARQYAYFQQLFQKNSYAQTLTINNYFTYDLYRWAVSTVMTRQNAIPTADGEILISALIPLWDMCNHANGKCTTEFDLEKDCLKSYSMENVQKGNEVRIFYGSRTNSEYFIHNGFVYSENENNSFPLQINISKSDPLAAPKNVICLKKGLTLNGLFHLKKQDIVTPDLQLFLKINVLKEDELTSVSTNENLLEDLLTNNDEIKNRALHFLRDRANLLLKCYGSSIEDDEKALESSTNPRSKMAIELRLCEKRLLADCIKYCSI